MSRAEEAAPEVRADLESILSTARKSLEAAAARRSPDEDRIGRGVARLARDLLRDAAQAHDYASLDHRLKASEDELKALLTILAAARRETAEREAARVAVEPFGEVGWEQRQRALAEALTAEPERGARQWVNSFAEALASDRVDVCLRLTDPGQSVVPQDEALVDELSTGARALSQDRLEDAVPMLRTLADGPMAPAITTADRVALLVLFGRILLSLGADSEARRRLEEASRAAARTEVSRQGLVAAALGECALQQGHDDEAAAQFNRAIQLAPSDPAGYVGNGLLAERREAWYQAQEWYDQAITVAGPEAVARKLRAPAPANLHWRLARSLRSTDPQAALESIERALELGVTGSGAYPQRKVLVEKAKILEGLSPPQPAAAAAAYYEAGRLSSWAGEQDAAEEQLQQACKLDGSVAVYHWELAETMRLTANSPDGTVDRRKVRLARDRWETGRANGRPDADTFWVYLTRALINLQLVGGGRSVQELAWESASLIERSLLLNASDAQAWAYLGMVHRALGNLRLALDATERAVQAEPTDRVALQQRMLSLAAVGDYEEAEKALDGIRDTPPWWIAYMRAYLRVGSDRPDEALELIGSVPVEDELEYRWARTYVFEIQGRRAEALEDYRWIWDNRSTIPGGASELRPAWAAYELGHYDVAEKIYREALDTDLLQDADAHVSLGMVLLARGDPDRGDIEEGEDLLARGIRLTSDIGDLQSLTKLALPELRRRVLDDPHGPTVEEILSLARAQVSERRLVVHNPSASPETEMRRALGEAGPNARGQGKRAAALAALARMADEAGRWHEALDRCTELLACGFDEARAGAKAAVEHVRQEADDMVRHNRLEEARESYRRLVEVVTTNLPEEPRLLAGLQARAGLATLELGDVAAAQAHLAATAAPPGHEPPLPDDDSLSQVFVRDTRTFWVHTDGLTRLIDDGKLPPGQHASLTAIRSSLSLSAVYALRRSDLDQAATFTLTNPVVVDLGSGLVPEDTGSNWVLFRELLPDMRRRVEKETGLRIPGVRFREGPQLAPGGYEITLHGITAAIGDADDDPAGGLDLIVRHLESVLRDNLAGMLSIDDVRSWLEGWDVEGDNRPLEQMVPDRASRVRLHRVLRLLLRESVPIIDRGAILRTFAGPAGARGVLAALREARRQLVTRLPGSGRGTPRALLPETLEDSIAAGMQAGDPPAWELPRATVAELLEYLRRWYGELSAAPPTAVVVRDPELRPFVWRLLSGDRRRPHVLAEEEVDARG